MTQPIKSIFLKKGNESHQGKVFIVDTNVLVSGLITKDNNSPTAQILDFMLIGNNFIFAFT